MDSATICSLWELILCFILLKSPNLCFRLIHNLSVWELQFKAGLIVSPNNFSLFAVCRVSPPTSKVIFFSLPLLLYRRAALSGLFLMQLSYSIQYRTIKFKRLFNNWSNTWADFEDNWCHKWDLTVLWAVKLDPVGDTYWQKWLLAKSVMYRWRENCVLMGSDSIESPELQLSCSKNKTSHLSIWVGSNQSYEMADGGPNWAWKNGSALGKIIQERGKKPKS